PILRNSSLGENGDQPRVLAQFLEAALENPLGPELTGRCGDGKIFLERVQRFVNVAEIGLNHFLYADDLAASLVDGRSRGDEASLSSLEHKGHALGCGRAVLA